MDPAAVTARLADLVAAAPGRLSVAVRARDGYRFDHDSARVVPAASTIKVPVLLAYLASGMPWDLPVALPAARVGGCGPLALLPSVTSLPAGEALRLMIALSDNDATNAVLGLVGVGEVARLLGRAGTRHTVLRRRMMDQVAAAAGHENETCAADLAELLAAVRAGSILPQREAAMALAVLREQQFDEGLPAYLPVGLRCASKTGSLPGVRHDIAVIESGDAWV
ncbi:MAG TPA: class A beta-lactamase-related serine hydrolase, partial [Dermatophilaceae bacterium]|nr:class A beta-lactamase-related serine hydrolase [Dermatophilaceae bacterium]